MIDVVNLYEQGATYQNIIINDFDRHIKDKSEGYRSRWTNSEYLLISDNISDLTNTLKSKPAHTIQKNDKIFFSKDSDYPSLLLSRLKQQYGVDVSRTITESKATKFIFNKEPLLTYRGEYRWNTLDDIHLTAKVNNTRILCVIPNTTDTTRLSFMKTSLEAAYNSTFYYAIGVKHGESAKLFVNHINESATTQELTKYVNSFIPVATQSEIDSVFNFLRSTDKSIRDTGINLFTTMNVSDQLYYVIKKACEMYYNSRWAMPGSRNACNSAWLYFMQYIDCTFEDLSKNFDTNQSYFLRKILQNPLYSGNMEAIKKEIKKQLLKRLSEGPEFKTLREDLELINCEIILHDKNGEADPGN